MSTDAKLDVAHEARGPMGNIRPEGGGGCIFLCYPLKIITMILSSAISLKKIEECVCSRVLNDNTF